MNRKDTDILLALPMAYQDGLDKFNGISRCLRVRRSGRYNIHLVREKLDLAELRTRLDDGIGAVIGDTVHFTDETLRELVRRNLPTVMFNPCEPDPFPAESTRIAYVRLDSNEIGRRACSFLQGQGAYASFGFVNDRAFRPWSRQREAAYVAALKESGITAHCYRPGSPETTFNAEARKHLLESTSLSVSEIADLTGFRTETYLMRLYKSRYGHTMRAR